jgi:hypothetical protein
MASDQLLLLVPPRCSLVGKPPRRGQIGGKPRPSGERVGGLVARQRRRTTEDRSGLECAELALGFVDLGARRVVLSGEPR